MRFRTCILTISLALFLIFGLIVTLDLATPVAAAEQQVLPAADVALAIQNTEAISDAVAWLAGQQNPDGGFGGAGVTADVVLAMAAANLEPRLMRTVTGTTPLDYLAGQAITFTLSGPAATAKLALAGLAADADPHYFGGLDLLDTLWASYSDTLGVFAAQPYTATTTWDQALAMLALAAAQEPVPQAAVDALLSWQESDGGWEFAPGSGWGTDPDSTALALMALANSGVEVGDETGGAVDAAVAFFRETQLEGGGWGGWGAVSPDSTALVIQALATLGYLPSAWSWATPTGGNPITELIALQLPDGSFPDWENNPSVMATAHALPGLAQAAFPVLGRSGQAHRALSWLAENQQTDGSFGSASDTADAMVAFTSAGFALPDGPGSPLDFLITQVPSYSHDGGEVGKLLLAAAASKVDPRDFGGYDLVVSMTDYLSPTGQFNTGSNFKQAIGILGLSAAGEPVPPMAVQWLLDQQTSDGSWEWAANSGWGSDPDTTAVVVQALIAAGEPSSEPAVREALAFLNEAQNPDAGFPSSFDPASNANTTAYVLQALVAAGEDLFSDSPGDRLVWVKNGRTVYDALQSFIKPDGPLVYQWGGFFGPTDNLIATIQSIPALLGRPLPVRPVVGGLSADSQDDYAAVVVDYNQLGVDLACIPISDATLSGVDLLQAAGIPVLATQDGAVCKIGDLGCPVDNCFCGGFSFWSYWYQDEDGIWQSYPVGAGDSEVSKGTVDGWRWAEWSPGMTGPSVRPSLSRLCAFEPFSPVTRGPDSDGMLAGDAILAPEELDGQLRVAVPFGSDLNMDSAVLLQYRPVGSQEWLTATLLRGEGVFTGLLALDKMEDYEFGVVYADPDGVRRAWGEMQATSVAVLLDMEAAPSEGEEAESVVAEPPAEPTSEPTAVPTLEPTPVPVAESTAGPAQVSTPEPTREPQAAESSDGASASSWWIWGVLALALLGGGWLFVRSRGGAMK